jgi:TATA-box binding protein (TBP) (component of TFIID and TFIIIB)
MQTIEPKNIKLIKEPYITAITASYTFDIDVCMSQLLEYTFTKVDEAMESNSLLLSEKNTKEKTQLHVPLPEITVNGNIVMMRTRYRNYTKNGRYRSNFRNSLCVYYIDSDKKKKCHKLFYNGNVHVTGYSQESRMTNETIELLKNAFSVIGQDWNDNKIKKSTIHMMNCVFKISERISLRKLYAEAPSEWDVIYNHEIYCGCMVRTSAWKANIFSTGSVIITACKSQEQLNTAYSNVLRFLDAWVKVLDI